jgi:hypothetical protein
LKTLNRVSSPPLFSFFSSSAIDLGLLFPSLSLLAPSLPHLPRPHKIDKIRPAQATTKIKMPKGKPIPNMMDNEYFEFVYHCLNNNDGSINFKEVAVSTGLKDASAA